ncbi:hypothetical protein PG999_008450 [Apiospora kogelbergensis]|uniref:Uncharacterized protein n=1 Tax=Apiospora kogelbergensis TaxID=1337665 RepID=A0AAW0QRE8_9PEZI
MSSPAYITRLPPEIRLMIFVDLIQSLLSWDCAPHFEITSPFYHLVLHGTSPFVGYEPVQKQGPNPWALLRVCKLFHREVRPLLDDLAPHMVYDFRYFLPEDMEAWTKAAGEKRIRQMRRWVVGGVRNCMCQDNDDVEGTWSDGDHDEGEDEEQKEAYDSAYQEDSMFHGYSISADLIKWMPDRTNHQGEAVDEEYRVFAPWEWDVWGTGHDSCFQNVEEPLILQITPGYMEQWEELGDPFTTAEMLTDMQSFIFLDLCPTRQARKDWTAFVRRLNSERSSTPSD